MSFSKYNNDDYTLVQSRDKKSHSKTYLKQVEKRNEKLAGVINQLPNKLKKKLTTDVQVVTTVLPCKPVTHRVKMPKFTLRNTYDEDCLGQEDAIAEMQALKKFDDVSTNQSNLELDYQIYFQKKTQYGEPDCSLEEMRKIRNALIWVDNNPEKEEEQEDVVDTTLVDAAEDEFWSMMDADDQLQEYIERLTEDALEDRD